MPTSNITSKINITPKGVCLPISKLHSILAVANISQICYCGLISLEWCSCSFSVNLTPFGVTCIMLAIVHSYAGAYPGIGQGGGHFSKFFTRVAKMSISISSACSHGEVYIRMVLAYSVFLWTYRETIRMSPTLQSKLIWWCTKSNFPYLEWEN